VRGGAAGGGDAEGGAAAVVAAIAAARGARGAAAPAVATEAPAAGAAAAGARGGARGRGAAAAAVPQTIDGLSIWKGPVGRITAIDLNTGEHLWMIPNGDASEAVQNNIRNNPLVQGLTNVPTNVGRTGHASLMATSTLLFATGQGSDSVPYLFAVDKRTGARLGKVRLPANSQYGMMTYIHDGKQYVVVQLPGRLYTLKLP